MAQVSVGSTRFTLQQLVDHAIARCKIPRQKIGAEHQRIARDNLSLALAEFSNKCTPLWCKERLFLGLYESVPSVQLPPGTVDVQPDMAFYRTSPRVGDSYISAQGVAANLGDGDLTTSCTQTSVNGNVQVQFLTPTIVNYVGVIPNGNQFYNLVFEASNDGLSWTTVQTIAPPFGQLTTSYPDAVWAWYEILSPTNGGSLFFRVRETSGGVLNLREFYLCSQPYDIMMARLNEQQWANFPNKRFPGRPLQFFLERTVDVDEGELCNMLLWPVPSTESAFASVFLTRKRYIADLQDFNVGVELPTRWYDPTIWWLASYLASEYEEVPTEREDYLAKRADDKVSEALSEERDNSPITIEPDIAAYTR